LPRRRLAGGGRFATSGRFATGSVSCANRLVEPRDRGLVTEIRHQGAGFSFGISLGPVLLGGL
jgi:hypothetical protein